MNQWVIRLNWFYYGLMYKLFPKNHFGIRQYWLDRQDANNEIRKKILANEPFMACRFGWTELSTMKAYEFNRPKNKRIHCMKNLCLASGFFPEVEEYGWRFLNLMQACCKDIDFLRKMNAPYENYFIRKYMRKSVTITGDIMEPWCLDNPWSVALEGKKVLVVHPFHKTIQQQYGKREFLFGDSPILPDFHLITYKSVQTMGNEVDSRFSDWFAALSFMINEIKNIDFDIAIVGCGAYGLPLASAIKRMGRQAIHMGGATQVLFGIKGQRWLDDANVVNIINESWVWPLDEETPRSAADIDGGYFKSGTYPPRF